MAKRGLRPRASWIVRWRLLVQTAFLGVWLLPLKLFSICSPVFHCYACPLAAFACPIGVVAQFSALHAIPFIALGTLIVVGGLLGAFICGWVCPFGWLQDVAAKVPTPKITLPRWTANVRYVVLIGLVLLVPYFLGEAHPLFFCRVCPAGALEGAAPSMVDQAVNGQTVVWPSVAKIVIVVAFVVAIFFIYRAWCTVLCPLGLIFGLFNRISAFFLRFNPKLCLDCTLCRKLCKVGVVPDQRANDPRCIRCLDCTRCTALTYTNVFKRPSGMAEAPEQPASKPKKTRLGIYVTSKSRTGGCDGTVKVPPFIAPAGTVALPRSGAAVFPKTDWPTQEAHLLVPRGDNLVFLDTSIFDEETPRAFWDALMRSDNEVVIINSVRDELRPWMKQNPENYAVRAVNDGRLVLKSIREFPDGNKITYRYYVNLLVERKLLLSKWWAAERLRNGCDPSDQALRAREQEIQRLYGVRCLALAKKHFRTDLMPGLLQHTLYTDESLVYIAAVSAIRSGRNVTIFSKDEDIHEQLYKLFYLMHTHYLSMRFAQAYTRDLLRFCSARTRVPERKWGWLLDDLTVTFIERPNDRPRQYYPREWDPVVVRCTNVGRKLFFSLFSLETGMGPLLDVKEKTGGLNVDWDNGENMHIWPYPLFEASPFRYSSAMTRDKRRETPWPHLRIPELDYVHAVLDCERFKLLE